MTRVDFYISTNTAAATRMQLACRLAEKAYLNQHRIYVHVANADEAKQLDTTLWLFRPGSFIPHCCTDDPQAAQAAVLIGSTEPPADRQDVLINLANDIPAFFSRFERVAELIGGDEATRQQGRERYKFYRDRGYPLHTHELSD